jgi:sulfur carrier protein ThiS adenylyltransferase
MPSFETIKRRLRDKKVGIAGSGGLGSNCAVALARVGVGNLILTDFDVVDPSNLNRQYFFHDQIGQKKVRALEANIKRINPTISIEAHDIKLDENSIIRIFRDCDVIVEAFDMDTMKQMIIETVLLNFPEKYLVVGSGLAGWGHNEKISQISYDRMIVCGDFESEVTENHPPLAPRVGIVANMQANVVLEILLGKDH